MIAISSCSTCRLLDWYQHSFGVIDASLIKICILAWTAFEMLTNNTKTGTKMKTLQMIQYQQFIQVHVYVKVNGIGGLYKIKSPILTIWYRTAYDIWQLYLRFENTKGEIKASRIKFQSFPCMFCADKMYYDTPIIRKLPGFIDFNYFNIFVVQIIFY